MKNTSTYVGMAGLSLIQLVYKATLVGLLSVFCYTLSSTHLVAQPAKAWDKTVGGTGYDELRSVQQTADGGYVLGGYSNSPAGGDKTLPTQGQSDYWAVKLNADGTKAWDKTISGIYDDELSSLQQTADGGYVLGGSSLSPAGGDKTQPNQGSFSTDYWVVKLNADGSIAWDKTIGGTSNDVLLSVQQTADGGYVLGGYSNSPAGGDKTQPNQGSVDYWVVKLNADGTKAWDKTFGGTGYDELRSVQQTADGGYMLGGVSLSEAGGDKTQNSKGGYDYWVVKLNADGTKAWDKTIGGTNEDRLYALRQTADGGYVLGGLSDSPAGGDKTQPNQGSVDYWVVKLNADGTKAWDKTFGGTGDDVLLSVQQTADGGYVLGGFSDSPAGGDKTQNSKGGHDYWVVKLNADGTKAWDKTFGGTGGDDLQSLQQTADGGYVLGGSSVSPVGGDKTQNSKGGYDYWVVKLENVACTNPAPNFTTDPVCLGTPTSFADASAAVAPDATYEWDVDNNGTVDYTTKGSISHTYAAAGTYTAKLTIKQGTCQASFTQTVVVNALPTATLSGDATICSGSSTNLSVVLTGSGPWSIAYSDGTTTTNVTATGSPFSIPVSPASHTTYTLTDVSDANCAGTVTGSATVTVNTNPVLTVPALAAVNSEANQCGATVAFAVTATGSPAPDITYKVGDAAVTSPYFFPVGTTTITAMAINSCGTDEKTFTVTVEDNTAPTVSCQAGPVSHCFAANNTYSVPALVANDNCSFASVNFAITGATNRTGSGIDASGQFQPGTSTILWTVIDPSGNQSQCSSTVVVNAPLSLTVPPVNPIGAGAQPNTIYTGYGPQNLTLQAIPTGGTAPYSYLWTGGSTAASQVVTAAGNYMVIVTDAMDCQLSFSVTIKVVDVRCGNKNDKVAICHKTGSAKNPWNQICISENAVAAHLANGSLLGQCGSVPGGRLGVEEGTGLSIILLANPLETGQVRARVRGAAGQPLRVELLELRGQVVRQQTWQQADTEQLIEWSLSAQPMGLYLLRAVSNGQRQTVKVIKPGLSPAPE